MTTLAERAQSIAAAARKPEAKLQTEGSGFPLREWWTIHKPGGEVVPVFFCPPLSQPDVRTKFYPGCGVIPL